MKRELNIITVLLGMVMMTLPCFGQLNPFETGGAEKPLLESSPTGGLDASPFIDRAREAAGQPPVPPPTAPAAVPPEVFPEEGFAVEGRPMMQPAAPLPTPTPFIRMMRVVTGRKVNCAVCGKLLEDIRYEEVPETMRDQFYDDGTHGDVQAGDGTYTNIEEIKDMIGSECMPLVIRLANLLLTSEEYGPLGFFRLFILTDEPVSLIGKRILTEEELDSKLESWAGIFFRMFRKNKDDLYSEFYTLYMPPPPMKPKYPMPPGFNPVEMEKMKEAQASQQAGAMMPEYVGREVTGEAEGAASSRYFK